MIWALDSSLDRPTSAQAAAAYAAGIRAWGGYLATDQAPGAFNLVAPWDRGSFQVVQAAGLKTFAFCSGLDDPSSLRQLAAEWGVLLLLDDEDGIRPLTQPDWRPAFLAASGAGLYGVLERQNIPAPFRIAALYPDGGCPGATWPTSAAPAEPHGWQCQGTHTEFGLSVDRSALDDWFGGEMLDPNDPIVQRLLQHTNTAASILALGVDTDPATFQALPNNPRWLADQVNQLTGFSPGIGQQVQEELAAIQQELATLSAQGVPPANLQPLQDAVARLSAHLGVGTA